MDKLDEHQARIPAWNLYGDDSSFPDILHCEPITDRASVFDWKIAPHRHHQLHQFFLIRSGRADLVLDGVVHDVTDACVLNVPRNVVHSFTFSAGTDGLVVTVPLQSLPDIFGTDTAMFGALERAALVPSDDVLETAFTRVSHEFLGRHPGRATMLRALTTQLACEMARRMPTDDEHPRRAVAGVFSRFQGLVRTHAGDAWTVRDYAAELGVSARHLSRVCQDAVGQSPAGFVGSERMREARRLLVYTRATIAEIGYALGYDDPSHFSRVFRRHEGLTPKEYRQGFDPE